MRFGEVWIARHRLADQVQCFDGPIGFNEKNPQQMQGLRIPGIDM